MRTNFRGAGRLGRSVRANAVDETARGRTRASPGSPADAAPTATRRPDEIRFAPGQSHEPGKSDTHRSVSWLTGHCTRHTFPDGHRRPVVVERTPLMSRARRLQLQGQPQNWPIETSLRSRYRHALSTFDSADARLIDFGRMSGKRAVPEQRSKTMVAVLGGRWT